MRFRTAIKEPEELSYLFLAIAIGLGLGADQRLITLVAFVLIVAAIWLRERSRDNTASQEAFLIVDSAKAGGTTIARVVDTLSQHCAAVNLKRYDESESSTEAHFAVEIDDFSQLQIVRDKLIELDQSMKITFLDGKSGI